jgi:hypothetical protein
MDEVEFRRLFNETHEGYRSMPAVHARRMIECRHALDQAQADAQNKAIDAEQVRARREARRR